MRSLVNSFAFLGPSARWFALAATVGVIAGLGCIAFQISEQVIFRYTTQGIAGFSPPLATGELRMFADPARPQSFVLLLVVLAGGGLAAGYLVQTFAPEAEGHGTDAAIEAYHQKRGYIRPIVPLIKLVASALTIGTGGSGGREGPIAQIGAGFGSLLGTQLKLSARDRRILLAAGMGAGIGAIFRAPMAGALFAAEILYRDSELEAEVIVPAAVSSIVGYSVYSYWLPAEIRFEPLFGIQPDRQLSSMAELGPMALLAVALVAMGILHVKVFYGLTYWFRGSRIPALARPALGALAAGLLAWGLYTVWGNDAHALGVLGTGYGTLQKTMYDPASIGAGVLLSIAAIKIATTALTIGSGGSGGVFGPSMVIGGCTGGAIGELMHRAWPALVPVPANYTILGMAGFFAGVAHAPISTIVMVTELTGDYSLLVPALWVSTLCFVFCQPWSLYEKQAPSRLDSPAHRGDFLVDILQGIKVKDVPWRQAETVVEGAPLGDVLKLVAESRQRTFPVVDAAGRLVGLFTEDDVRRFAFDQSLWKLAVARDVMTSPPAAIRPDDDLNSSLGRFTELNLDELPVVADDDPGRLLGILTRHEVIAQYNRTLLTLQQSASDA